jgi:hypothetical protein
MQFDDPHDQATAFLILRHLYDGDVIEWPIGADHPLHHVFSTMEAQGYIARWDRMWPRHDRYRLTDLGIATIEAVYRPSGAEALYHDLRGRGLGPAQRRAYLIQQGYDPMLWPLLHDPTTHWDMYRQDRGRYYDWFWEDQQPYRRRRAAAVSTDDDLDVDDIVDTDTDDTGAPRGVAAAPYLVDLDREAAHSGQDLGPATADYDVS